MSKIFVKKLTDVQRNILTFVKLSKFGTTNQEISNGISIIKQTVSNNVKKLVDLGLLTKNNFRIRLNTVKKTNGPCVNRGVHQLLFEVPILKYSKDFFDRLECKKYETNGVVNYFIRKEIDCETLPENLRRYGKLEIGLRFMLGTHSDNLLLSFKHANVFERYDEALKDYHNILFMFLQHFKAKNKGIFFDSIRLEQVGNPHYKIGELPDEFKDFQYSDEEGLIIDSSPPEKTPHAEQRNIEKAQSISDIPETIEKTNAKIASLDEIIVDLKSRIEKMHVGMFLANEEKKLEKKYEDMFR